MKKLHVLLIKSFVGPFLATFGISIFLFLMLFMWKYIGELVGKGLEWYVIMEFILYSIPYLIPRALPLAVLLSSIMVFGNLGERYELVAMKSAGVSLIRSMKPLLWIMVLIAGIAFYSSNVLIPRANLSWGALFYDVTHKKPALNIQDGIFFSQIKGFALRVGKKHDDNKTLEDVLIYSSSGKSGVTNVIIARKGVMNLTNNERFLELTLYDGKRYQEMTESPHYGVKFQHNTMQFSKYEMAIDMSELQLQRSNPNSFRDNDIMLNLSEIDVRVDSVDILIGHKKAYLLEYLRNYVQIPLDSNVKRIAFEEAPPSIPYHEQLRKHVDTSIVQVKRIHVVSPANRKDRDGDSPVLADTLFEEKSIEFEEVIKAATQSTRNIHRIVETNTKEVRKMLERRRRYSIQWHKKFTLAFSCLLLFFIGAPLGAIIRKGGFGTPMIIAILLFIVFFILQTVGEKLAREGVLEVWAGAWLSSAVFLPLAIFLTTKSNTESALFDADAYKRFFRRIFKRTKEDEAK